MDIHKDIRLFLLICFLLSFFCVLMFYPPFNSEHLFCLNVLYSKNICLSTYFEHLFFC